ncbi:NAD(P)-dependent oxidoreductase [uncultured Desulfovibrio sp.]|uniref:NAD-dependent epimerase/dehydratase family protein n=1 Tax=uncultured Desulfovibrio sp. TaxID=167968 RepID=UPI002639C1EE|nr:NAD(P)-dependent oxidoreductase [uncultured Desulfovibrio sp.]
MSAPAEQGFPHLSGKRVLVTGGTGFVGRHLLPRLLENGARVTCLTRAASRTEHLPGDVAVARADLGTGHGLAAALAGQDMIIHMAALLFGLGWQDYLRANAMAARVIVNTLAEVDAAGQGSGQGGPARFVLVSSLAASGPSNCPPGVADDVLPAPVSAYGWSKLLVEQILGRALGDRLVTLRPPIIYGSGDRGLLPVFKGAARGFAVSSGAFREFPVSAVHARDMAQAVLLCCGAAARGVYHVNDGGLYDMSRFCRIMGEALGRGKLRVLHLPLPLMAVTAGLASCGGMLWARLAREFTGRAPVRAPNWNLDKYREARQTGWLCDASRIRRELGYEPRVSLAEGMAEAVEGYRREGWL